jgi:hypothetical protein
MTATADYARRVADQILELMHTLALEDEAYSTREGREVLASALEAMGDRFATGKPGVDVVPVYHLAALIRAGKAQIGHPERRVVT